MLRPAMAALDALDVLLMRLPDEIEALDANKIFDSDKTTGFYAT